MTPIKRRLGHAAIFFLVGAITLLPVSAFASPSAGPTGDNLVDAQYQANDDKDKDDKDKCKDDPKDKDKDKDDKDKGKDDPKDKCKDDPKDKDDKDKGKDDPKDKGKDKPSDTRVDVVLGLNGLGSVDVKSLPIHLGAAIVLFDQNDHDHNLEAAGLASAPVERPTNKISASIIRTLAPVLPPMAIDVVVAPIVVAEALIEAMASSGQALVIPFLAGAAVLFAPGVRRKDLLAKAIDPDIDPGP